MRIETYIAVCPCNIGDKVKIKNFIEIQIVEDIRAIHYQLAGTTDFEIKLKNETGYISANEIVKIIYKEEIKQ